MSIKLISENSRHLSNLPRLLDLTFVSSFDVFAKNLVLENSTRIIRPGVSVDNIVKIELLDVFRYRIYVSESVELVLKDDDETIRLQCHKDILSNISWNNWLSKLGLTELALKLSKLKKTEQLWEKKLALYAKDIQKTQGTIKCIEILTELMYIEHWSIEREYVRVEDAYKEKNRNDRRTAFDSFYGTQYLNDPRYQATGGLVFNYEETEGLLFDSNEILDILSYALPAMLYWISSKLSSTNKQKHNLYQSTFTSSLQKTKQDNQLNLQVSEANFDIAGQKLLKVQANCVDIWDPNAISIYEFSNSDENRIVMLVYDKDILETEIRIVSLHGQTYRYKVQFQSTAKAPKVFPPITNINDFRI